MRDAECDRLREVYREKREVFHRRAVALACVMENCGYDEENPQYYEARISFRLAWEDMVEAGDQWENYEDSLKEKGGNNGK